MYLLFYIFPVSWQLTACIEENALRTNAINFSFISFYQSENKTQFMQ